MIPTLYGYSLEGISYELYQVLRARALRENHPDIAWIEDHIKFKHCFYCHHPTLASLFTTQATINLTKHQKRAHPFRYLWDWINHVAPASL